MHHESVPLLKDDPASRPAQGQLIHPRASPARRRSFVLLAPAVLGILLAGTSGRQPCYI